MQIPSPMKHTYSDLNADEEDAHFIGEYLFLLLCVSIGVGLDFMRLGICLLQSLGFSVCYTIALCAIALLQSICPMSLA